MNSKLCGILVDELNSPHGTEMLAVLLALMLKRKGWRVVIHTGHFSPRRSKWADLLAKSQIQVIHPGFRFLTRYNLPNKFAAWKFWHWCRKHKPDIIWSPSNDTLTCLALNTKPDISPPFFVHDPSEASPSCPHYQKKWFELCNKVTALSVHGDRQRVSALQYYRMKQPVEVVYPSSIVPQHFFPLGKVEEKIRFGQFGRIFSMKGSLFSVAAFSQVLSRGINAELHFFGDGPLRYATEELASSLGIASKVFFHGAYLWTNMDELVASIDVGLMPSTYEGFGLVMLELLSRGRPVIASDVGSSREVLEKFDAGLVVPRADTAGLASAMIELSTNPARLRVLASNARVAWETHFTPEAMVNRYLDFWSRYADIN